MRELIAFMVIGLSVVAAIYCALRLGSTRRTPGKHSSAYRPEPAPAPTVRQPSRSWVGPSSAQAREIFRPVDATMQLRPCSPEELERRYAAGFAAIGVDYWHSTAGPDFSRRTAGVAA
ncbi:hypothetical protein ACFVT6_18120 [Streptomyces sp. NPDC058049]|uniref:hypothetical protein n=1 Tax=Streptomyces sp. NPDC058049 TaxID=3346314 RepID=UPI0036E9F6FC